MIYRRQAFSPSYDLAPPSPPTSPVSKLSLFLSLPVCHRKSLLMGERGWMGRSQISRRRESIILYKPLNTLCLGPTSSTNGFISLMTTSPLVSSLIIYFMVGGKDLVRNPRACHACTQELFIIRSMGTEISIFCIGCIKIAAPKK